MRVIVKRSSLHGEYLEDIGEPYDDEPEEQESWVPAWVMDEILKANQTNGRTIPEHTAVESAAA